MLDYQERVIKERDELKEKLGKLNGFITDSPFFIGINSEEQKRLKNQYIAMCEYLKILDERIANFK